MVRFSQKCRVNMNWKLAGIAEAIAYTKLPPTKKYTTPQTEAQEYGWISTPLVRRKRYYRTVYKQQ